MDCHILDRSPCHYMRQSYQTGVFFMSTLRSLSNDDGDGNESGNRLAKQQLGTSITLLFHILAVVARLTAWECLISRFVKDGNSRQQLSFSFLELWYSSLGFKSNWLGLNIYIYIYIYIKGLSTWRWGTPDRWGNICGGSTNLSSKRDHERLSGQVGYLTYLGSPTSTGPKKRVWSFIKHFLLLQ